MDELDKLYLNQAAIGGFASAGYWSSSEGNASFAWLQHFDSGYRANYVKYTTVKVRAVRAF